MEAFASVVRRSLDTTGSCVVPGFGDFRVVDGRVVFEAALELPGAAFRGEVPDVVPAWAAGQVAAVIAPAALPEKAWTVAIPDIGVFRCWKRPVGRPGLFMTRVTFTPVDDSGSGWRGAEYRVHPVRSWLGSARRSFRRADPSTSRGSARWRQPTGAFGWRARSRSRRRHRRSRSGPARSSKPSAPGACWRSRDSER